MKALDMLLKAAENRKLSHAYLFSGNDEKAIEEGLKKFLKALKECELIRIKAEESETQNGRKEIKVAQMRELISLCSLSSWTGKLRVAVIEKAHTMNQEAQSAFLKLLEEPKGNTVFILLSKSAAALLETIKSRVQEIKFYNFIQDSSDKAAKELQRLEKATIRDRFEKAKDMAEEPELIQNLKEWQAGARQLLISNLKNEHELKRYRKFIEVLMDITESIQQTNAQRRLALENILLSL